MMKLSIQYFELYIKEIAIQNHSEDNYGILSTNSGEYLYKNY